MRTPEGAPTATWAAGSQQSWNISGIGNHYGGSCQVGFSTDRGESFKVATSYEGNCPHRNNGVGPEGQDFDFTVPDDIDTGVQVFAWIWYNREQEFNMDCAAVNITSSTKTTAEPSSYAALPDRKIKRARHIHGHPHHPYVNARRSPTALSTPTSSSTPVTFTDRPLMLVADDENGCLTPKTTAELKYPNPGPAVFSGDGAYPLELPTGNCSAMPGTQAYGGATGEDGH